MLVRRILSIVSFIAFVALTFFFYLDWRISRDSQFLSGEEVPEALRVYLPSPFEYYNLESEKKLWPRRYNEKYPLMAENIPQFYTWIQDHLNSDVEGYSYAGRFRYWSVFVNSGNMSALRYALHQSRNFQPKDFSEALRSGPGSLFPECSMVQKERVFRLSQAWPQWSPESWDYLRKCDPESVLSFWMESIHLSGLLKSDLADQGETIQRLREIYQWAEQEKKNPERRYSRYFAKTLSDFNYLYLAHQKKP